MTQRWVRLFGALVVVIAVGLLVPPLAQFAGLFFFVWILVVSSYMLARSWRSQGAVRSGQVPSEQVVAGIAR